MFSGMRSRRVLVLRLGVWGSRNPRAAPAAQALASVRKRSRVSRFHPRHPGPAPHPPPPTPLVSCLRVVSFSSSSCRVLVSCPRVCVLVSVSSCRVLVSCPRVVSCLRIVSLCRVLASCPRVVSSSSVIVSCPRVMSSCHVFVSYGVFIFVSCLRVTSSCLLVSCPRVVSSGRVLVSCPRVVSLCPVLRFRSSRRIFLAKVGDTCLLSGS